MDRISIVESTLNDLSIKYNETKIMLNNIQENQVYILNQMSELVKNINKYAVENTEIKTDMKWIKTIKIPLYLLTGISTIATIFFSILSLKRI